MKESQVKRERDKVKELAKEYRSRGYKVIVEPDSSDLPVFIRNMNFQPDLIALGERDNLIFEVVTSSTVKGVKAYARLADTIREHEGWDFVFVMTNPKETPTPEPNVIYPSIHDVHHYVDKAKLLLDANKNDQFNEAALLMAWSGVEAVIRFVLSTVYKKKVERNITSLLRDSVMYGIISNNEAKCLDSILVARNKIAHGFAYVHTGKSEVTKLIEIIKRINSELEKQES